MRNRLPARQRSFVDVEKTKPSNLKLELSRRLSKSLTAKMTNENIQLVNRCGTPDEMVMNPRPT